MTTQEENELICERLLGWVRNDSFAEVVWRPGTKGSPFVSTPTFTTWTEAGLVLDALNRVQDLNVEVGNAVGCWYCEIDLEVQRQSTGPLAVHAAALTYLEIRDDE